MNFDWITWGRFRLEKENLSYREDIVRVKAGG